MSNVWRFVLSLTLVLVMLPATALQAQENALSIEIARFQQDQANERFFPETGYTVRGRFLEYWDEQGGLPVFGYPLTEARYEVNSSGDYVLTQYFERQRFELHPNNEAPYDVLLGRLGAEILMLSGINPDTIPNAAPEPNCVWFEETAHNVCNQGNGLGFLNYWSTHGLEFDGAAGTSRDESVALFGYPLNEPQMETNSSGDTVLTQWFERARFEWHPDNPDEFKVLLGRLGAELLEQRGDLPVVSEVNVYLIALEQGDVGCNDALVPVQRQVSPTTAPLHAAMIELLSISQDAASDAGFYTALDQSDLAIESITISDTGLATMRLTGQLSLGGVCDNPRVEAQLEQTALQFETVNSVDIYINDQPLADALSLR